LSQEKAWNKRAGQWHSHVNSSAAFEKVLEPLLVVTEPQPDDVCVDLGRAPGS